MQSKRSSPLDQKKLLIIQHESSSPAGTTLEWCRLRKIEPLLWQASLGNFPEIAEFSGILILGGDMNVDEEKIYPWLLNEKKFIKNIIDQAIPTLGICLGGQLLAESLGGRVSRHAFAEKGLSQVYIQLGLGLPGEGELLPVMQWHEYSFDIPDGARRAFQGDAWENQGFIYKDFAVATQFHPEVTQEFMQDCYSELGLEINESSAKALLQIKNWYFQLLDFIF